MVNEAPGVWGDGEMGRWGDGEMGRWGGECGINSKIYILTITMQDYQNLNYCKKKRSFVSRENILILSNPYSLLPNSKLFNQT